jgi:hypothetical protein
VPTQRKSDEDSSFVIPALAVQLGHTQPISFTSELDKVAVLNATPRPVPVSPRSPSSSHSSSASVALHLATAEPSLFSGGDAVEGAPSIGKGKGGVFSGFPDSGSVLDVEGKALLIDTSEGLGESTAYSGSSGSGQIDSATGARLQRGGGASSRAHGSSAGVGPSTPAGLPSAVISTPLRRHRGQHLDQGKSAGGAAEGLSLGAGEVPSLPTIYGTPSSTTSGIAEAAMAAATEYAAAVADLQEQLASARRREDMLRRELDESRKEAAAGRDAVHRELEELRAAVASLRRPPQLEPLQPDQQPDQQPPRPRGGEHLTAQIEAAAPGAISDRSLSVWGAFFANAQESERKPQPGLLAAVCAGDSDAVRRLLADGRSPTEVVDGTTPLHAAAAATCDRAVLAVLCEGATTGDAAGIDVLDSSGRTPALAAGLAYRKRLAAQVLHLEHGGGGGSATTEDSITADVARAADALRFLLESAADAGATDLAGNSLAAVREFAGESAARLRALARRRGGGHDDAAQKALESAADVHECLGQYL